MPEDSIFGRIGGEARRLVALKRVAAQGFSNGWFESAEQRISNLERDSKLFFVFLEDLKN